MLSWIKIEDATIVNLLPVCESSHVFREIKINRKMTTIDNFNVLVESRFEPPICPNCKRFIEEIEINENVVERVEGQLNKFTSVKIMSYFDMSLHII